ncbi:tRNA (N(6)-L-threonylcarbamoyladenosine(37)-C(2))-methylthiotransferase MtaB [Fusibacter ferrireducens]|uniref:tRNA (N(6)-L-threonylcarbamoyladenosine(37)-C(2))-methylthiotransferase n=1 Tax=Fusibacter ferrireducens TaxID=2785058 RepID=A0ABR9ZWS9_9FIRM|nr:tRNA (N(6)-L-threonylcarbamoyladenosine(37)-C(2))-methylthiotransferase MtaB [Fusibacter ferrireducens]MBF4694915.1 tRNA (N(6)-L-threonylcarbamoyladenosine(37)-C(2))-methylthiotransferase MtaB [Fusibacter ferrireducens]
MEKNSDRKANQNISGNEIYEKNNTVSFMTLGCKTNQYETDALMDLFYNHRFEIVEFDDYADVYVINTCTVTNVGDQKSRQMIRRAKKNNPDAIVVVVGCYAQISPEEVSAIQGVDIIVGTDARGDIIKYIEDYQNGLTEKPYVIVNDIMKIKQFEELTLKHIKEHTRAFIKIQEGCNQFCSYCIIPYARGQVRSRSLENIITEISELALQGYKEFVLTGIHIGSYGLDFKNIALIDLLEAIQKIEGVERIRLGSIEPRLITSTFIERLKPLDKVCDHFHLSLQSGSDTVLKRMNRKYCTTEYMQAVTALRQVYSTPSITTDIIVGFPGETDEEFKETFDFVKQIQFSEIHVFKFSKRESTPAAKMPKQIDGEVKKKRSEALIALGATLESEYRSSYIGKSLEVLFETYKSGKWIGHTTNYIKVVVPDRPELDLIKKICKVSIETLDSHQLIGKIIS